VHEFGILARAEGPHPPAPCPAPRGEGENFIARSGSSSHTGDHVDFLREAPHGTRPPGNPARRPKDLGRGTGSGLPA
jgi:hypothetical protein